VSQVSIIREDGTTIPLSGPAAELAGWIGDYASIVMSIPMGSVTLSWGEDCAVAADVKWHIPRRKGARRL
jgi:hypothetical protein